MDQVNGLLVIDKPGAITSRDVVNSVEEWFPRVRVGHTGTLDPLATGVLVVCLGRATRLADYVQALDKVYRTRIQFGAVSDTDDADGMVEATEKVVIPDKPTVSRAVQQFIGEIQQVPPAYSAAKVTGKRAYRLARRGHEVSLNARTVRVYSITMLSYAYPHLDLEIHCGKGTYIRSLARDLGQQLGCGGHVETLRRLRVGPFRVEDALSLTPPSPPGGEGRVPPDSLASHILPLERAVCGLPRVMLSADEAWRLSHGQVLRFQDAALAGQEVAILTQTLDLIAIANADAADGCLHPLKVFQHLAVPSRR